MESVQAEVDEYFGNIATGYTIHDLFDECFIEAFRDVSRRLLEKQRQREERAREEPDRRAATEHQQKIIDIEIEEEQRLFATAKEHGRKRRSSGSAAISIKRKCIDPKELKQLKTGIHKVGVN